MKKRIGLIVLAMLTIRRRAWRMHRTHRGDWHGSCKPGPRNLQSPLTSQSDNGGSLTHYGEASTRAPIPQRFHRGTA